MIISFDYIQLFFENVTHSISQIPTQRTRIAGLTLHSCGLPSGLGAEGRGSSCSTTPLPASASALSPGCISGAETVAASDTGSDVGPDTGSDAVPDAGSDTGSDAAPDAAAATAAATSDTGCATGTDLVSGSTSRRRRNPTVAAMLLSAASGPELSGCCCSCAANADVTPAATATLAGTMDFSRVSIWLTTCLAIMRRPRRPYTAAMAPTRFAGLGMVLSRVTASVSVNMDPTRMHAPKNSRVLLITMASNHMMRGCSKRYPEGLSLQMPLTRHLA